MCGINTRDTSQDHVTCIAGASWRTIKRWHPIRRMYGSVKHAMSVSMTSQVVRAAHSHERFLLVVGYVGILGLSNKQIHGIGTLGMLTPASIRVESHFQI